MALSVVPPLGYSCAYCGQTEVHLKDCPEAQHAFANVGRWAGEICDECGKLNGEGNHGQPIATDVTIITDDPDVVFVEDEEDDEPAAGEGVDIDTLVDGKEARIIGSREPGLLPVPDVRDSLHRLEIARRNFAEASLEARDATAKRKERQEQLNIAVDRAIEAMHAIEQPGLFG